MKTPPDLSTWYTKQRAIDAIGISVKTLQQLVKDGKIQQRIWKRPGGGQPLAVLAPEDVARIANERQAGKAFVLAPPPAAPANGANGHGLMVGSATGATSIEPVRQTIDARLSDITHEIKMLQESSVRLAIAAQFLTIEQASNFSGLSAALIRRECQAGRLVALKDGGWKILRASLLDWRPGTP
jgi:hypothetical protein